MLEVIRNPSARNPASSQIFLNISYKIHDPSNKFKFSIAFYYPQPVVVPVARDRTRIPWFNNEYMVYNPTTFSFEYDQFMCVLQLFCMVMAYHRWTAK